MSEKILRRLVIRAFHIEEVLFGNKTEIEKNKLIIDKNIIGKIEKDDLVKDIKIDIIKPKDHDRYINTIMDIIPISTKVLGNLGEGISHTLTGVYVMLTGCDETGFQLHEFGSSEGNMKEKLMLGKAGTPSENDYIIHIDVTVKKIQIFDRNICNEVFKAADNIIQIIREKLKKIDGREATEAHEYFDKIREGKKKVVILKQIAGQGAMYDNILFPDEPSGFSGGTSIIDMGNMPVVLTPNEYRDGAIRALT